MLFSTDTITEYDSKIPENNTVGITTSYFEFAVDYIIQERSKPVKPNGKMSLRAKLIDSIKSFRLENIKNHINFAAAFGNKFNNAAVEMTQDLYDKIVEAIKEDKSSGFYKFIVDNRSDIRNQSIVFKGEMYPEYTNVTTEKNTASFKADINKSFKEFVDICMNISRSKTPNDFNNTMDTLKKKNKEKDKNLSTIRGRLVNQYSVDEEDFPESLIRFFRHNDDKKTPFYIPPEGQSNVSDDIMRSACDEYVNIDKSLKFLTEYSSHMQKELYTLCGFYDNSIRPFKFPREYYKSEYVLELVKLFVSIEDIIDVYLLYLGAKLDAEWERFQRDRKLVKLAAIAYKKSNKDEEDF